MQRKLGWPIAGAVLLSLAGAAWWWIDRPVEVVGTRATVGPAMEVVPDRMSGGQRQRVAIARALANDPSLVLGDEPTGNLDSQNSARVVAIFPSLAKKQGRAVVCVTHDPEVAAAADVRVHMLAGAIEKFD